MLFRSFDITDIFLKNKPVSTNYEFSITQNNQLIFEQNGISTDSKTEHNVIDFFIPENISGIVNLNFKNLDGNEFATTSIPIAIHENKNNNSISLPESIKNDIQFWSEGKINDSKIIEIVNYLIESEIIKINYNSSESIEKNKIPSWIQIIASWWVDDQIDDESFFKILEFLTQKQIIPI